MRGAAARNVPADFFAELCETFTAAAGRLGSRVLYQQCGPFTIRLVVAAPELETTLARGLAHTSPVPPDGDAVAFEVLAFDLTRAGLPQLRLPWRAEDVRAHGEVRGFNDARFRTLHEVAVGELGLSMIDHAARRAVFVAQDAGRMSSNQWAAPLRSILHLGLTSSTTLLLHAAAVGEHGRGLLLAGAGGSGKSTTAVACAAAGMQFAGDDSVLLDTADTPVVHSLYRTAKLGEFSRSLLPAVDPYVLRAISEDDKDVVEVDLAFPGRLVTTLPVSAIVLPRLAPGASTRLVPASGAAAVRALAPSTVLQRAGNGGVALGRVAGIARQAPCYELALGDGSPVPVLAELLSDI